MLYVVDRDTPEDAPNVNRMPAMSQRGLSLGRPLDPPPGDLVARVTSLRRPPDVWWIGPLFCVSRAVHEAILESGETHLEAFPLALTTRRGGRYEGLLLVNLLDNVPCLDRQASIRGLDYSGRAAPGFDRLVVDESRVPAGRTLFRSAEAGFLILARPELVERLQGMGARGARFVPVETSAPPAG